MLETILAEVSGLTITAALGVVAVSLALWTMVRPRDFPPGPRGFPVVGSLFSLVDSPEIVFSNWAKIYGDIYGFKVGERWMVVLNRQEVIKEALVKQSAEFASRPDFPTFSLATDGCKDIAFSPYTETWKLHRKLGHSALRHFATGKPLQALISSMFPKVEAELEKVADKPVNPKDLLNLLLYNVLSTMCFGKSYEMSDPRIMTWQKLTDEVNAKVGMGLADDIFSIAKYLPSSKREVVADLIHKTTAFIKNELGDKDSFDEENINDIYSLLLKAQAEAKKEGINVEKVTDAHLIQTITDIFGAGTQTTADTLNWQVALMTEYPDVAARVRAEIDSVIGRDRLPVIEDRDHLPYTVAALYEGMRYSSIAPMALPHATTKDVTLRGYVIPKGTTIMINVFSMHFDPKEWADPESFKPEHFLDESGTIRQHPPSFMPFGAGRRSCLGEAVAKADLFLIFTWFMQNYTFSKVPGKEEESLIQMIPKTAAGRILLPYEIMINKRG